MFAWLFWDDSRLADLGPDELEAHIEELRRTGQTRRLPEIAHCFEIERSERAHRFVDPLPIRIYERYLRGREGTR